MKVHTSLAVALAAVGGLAATSHAALVYQNTFAGGSGVPSTGAGTLVVTNGPTPGTGAFTTTGGIDGNGQYVSNNTYNSQNPSSVASTGGTGASTIAGLPTSLGQFTVSFWVRTAGTAGDGTGTVSTNEFGRVFILGASNTQDQGANAVGVEFRAGQLDFNVNNNAVGGASSRGAVLAANTWNFVAFTYDGTSAGAFDSTAQLAASGNTNNTQLYEGTSTTPVTQTSFGSALNSGSFNVSTGPIALGSSASLLLLNRANLQRGVNGSIDDFRIYDSILTPAQVEAVRASAVAAPEPTTLAAVAGGAVALLRRRRRSL